MKVIINGEWIDNEKSRDRERLIEAMIEQYKELRKADNVDDADKISSTLGNLYKNSEQAKGYIQRCAKNDKNIPQFKPQKRPNFLMRIINKDRYS